MIRRLLWWPVAALAVAARGWLIRRALRTPYSHITGPDGSTYMRRWWLFNPYTKDGGDTERKVHSWLPSVRIHHIMRPDSDRHLHDHPWNARTIVLEGWYVEQRPYPHDGLLLGTLVPFTRKPGSTARLLYGEYHRISAISHEGVWTLFITWRYRGTWGFWDGTRKVPWREYLAERDGDGATQPSPAVTGQPTK